MIYYSVRSNHFADPACYPYNLDCVYPFVNATETTTQTPFEPSPSRGYPLLVICMSSDLFQVGDCQTEVFEQIPQCIHS